MFAHAHSTTPFSQFFYTLPISNFFHTHPRIPLTSSLNLARDSSNTCCMATYCTSLPPHTFYSDQDLNPIN